MPKKKPSINLDAMKGVKTSVRPVDKLKTKQESETRVPIQIYCTEAQKKQLKLASIESGKTMTDLLTEALESVVKKYS